MIGAPVLFAAQQDVARRETVACGEEFAMWRVKRQGHPGLGAGRHQRRGTGNVPAETRDAIEVVQRHAEFAFALMADLHSRAVLAQIRAFQGHEQGIEVVLH